MKRKKWSELEEQTLLTNYSDLHSCGALAKLKTREKKFKPIADHVNSAHHLRDPVTFPFRWSWRDVSIKVQNMRHQYLGVKQKIRVSKDEFNWKDGENHWENFLRYKEVFGDVELDVRGKRGCESENLDVFGDCGDLGFGIDCDDLEEEEDDEDGVQLEEGEDGEEEESSGGGEGDNGVEELGRSEGGELVGERAIGEVGFAQKRKLGKVGLHRRLGLVSAQVLDLRDVVVKREERRRERECRREKSEVEREEKRKEIEFRREKRRNECKKIMVLYMSTVRGGKPVKTNWVMHQYHLGIEEDEKDGEYVISKIYYQQQEAKQADKTDQDVPESIDAVITKVDPVTPKLVTPEPPRAEQKLGDFDLGLDTPAPYRDPFLQYRAEDGAEDEVHPDVDSALDEAHPEVNRAEDVRPESEIPDDYDQHKVENQADEVINNTENIDHAQEDPKWWDNESQNLLDSQQLVEGLSLCDELLQSQSPNRGGHENGEQAHVKPRLADYAKLGPEDLKKDLEACQNIVLDPANIMDLDTPPDFRLSQLEFGSQESFLSWGGKVAD